MKTVLATAFLLGAMSGAAFADPSLPTGLSWTDGPAGFSAMTLNMPSYSVNVYAGALSLTLDDGTEYTDMFRTGINGAVASAANYTEFGSASPSSPGSIYSEYGLNRSGYNAATQSIKIGQMDGLLRGYADGPAAFSSAAVQLALWTVEFQTGVSGYDPTNLSLGFSASNVDATVLGQTDTLLADVQNGTFGPMDMIPGGVQAGNPQQTLIDPVPEPSTYLIMSVGVLGMIGVYRRKMV